MVFLRSVVEPPLQAPGGLHLDLDMLPLEPLEHELVLLGRGKARSYRLPWAPCPDAAVFRLRDADQALLRDRVHRMVVDAVPELELPADRVLAGQRVRLVHRHQPAPRERLLGSIPEVALIAGIDRNRSPIRPCLMPL